jgi:hypothetical protein
MFLGRYDYDGDPAVLLPAYDSLMAEMPPGQVFFHACVVRDGGITIYDACPDAAVFAAFSSDPDTLAAMAAAGLPAPVVTPLGDVHNALASV